MLRDILLSLSGQHSPIWSELNDHTTSKSEGDKDTGEPVLILQYSSAAEKSMLKVLAELSNLHIEVRKAADEISRTHRSPICRSIGGRIISTQLKVFTTKVLEVESCILTGDSEYVSAYKSVPLSTIVNAFEPSLRLFKWMLMLVHEIQRSTFTGAQLIGKLDKESFTGFRDVKDAATDLSITAQQAWLQSLIPWIFYGRLPSFGKDDFLIQQDSSPETYGFVVDSELTPYFVLPKTAEALKAVGQILNHITHDPANYESSSMVKINELVAFSSRQIRLLRYPISADMFERTIAAINDNISVSALAAILPVATILQFLRVARSYVLLQDGDFSSTLIGHANSAFRSRHKQPVSEATLPVRKLGRTHGLTIHQYELNGVMDRTWSELSLSIGNDQQASDHEQAAIWLRLQKSAPASQLVISTLFAVPSHITISLDREAPLRLFVSKKDIVSYQKMSSYLLSLQKAKSQISRLWQIPTMRRSDAASMTSMKNKVNLMRHRRQREQHRDRLLRGAWACASRIHFLLSEICQYLHSEVIPESCANLEMWLKNESSEGQAASNSSSRPVTMASNREHAFSNLDRGADSDKATPERTGAFHNPQRMAQAHQEFLRSLHHNLLLDNDNYIALLREFCTSVDHMVALFHRLDSIWQEIDLQETGLQAGAISDPFHDEKDLIEELHRTTSELNEQISEIVETVHESNHAWSNDYTSKRQAIFQHSPDSDSFQPWTARSMDRLLIKLDSLVDLKSSERYEDAVLDFEEN